MDNLPKDIANIIMDYKLDLEISEKVLKQKRKINNEITSYLYYDNSMKYVFLYIKLTKLFENHLKNMEKIYYN